VTAGATSDPLPVPPHAALRATVLDLAQRLDAAGQADAARELHAAMDAWWQEQQGWTGEVARQLGVHHDINNALVGVRGNAQLLLMGPAAQVPGARDRLEVVLRESDRIREAAQRLNALKSALTAVAHESAPTPASRAA
jgi:nitrogen-specific signal transduction histidine kinase